ncbi:MAG TPA: hypothetical protein VFS62_09235 [Chloroflexota bacterium]|nr:hypothetical protein [Chloroflexota bacterium]
MLLASCGQILVQPQSNGRDFGPLTSSDSLNPPLVYTPTPQNQVFPGLTPPALGTPAPQPTPNPIMTPYSYLKENQFTDLLNNGQEGLVIVAGDRRPSPPQQPTPVLQNQKGEYPGNFTYNLEVWNWDPKTNQYSLSALWPNDPSKRYIDMRYNLADLVGDGTQQVLVQSRLEGTAEALDYAVLRIVNGQVTVLFQQSGLEHGQVRLIGKNIWQEQSVRQPNEDVCCPSKYRDDAFVWNGTTFAPEPAFAFPTPVNFPPPTPEPLQRQATPVPLSQVSVPYPSH